MQRCLHLAMLGAGRTAPNPMVGAVLVHENVVIGEGYHKKYGEAHAEVNCIEDAIARLGNKSNSVLANSTLYVSLEPCSHFGKTPPCADFIIRHRIPKVVVGCRDPFHAVNGKGIERLYNAGIKVQLGILGKDCRELNKRFLTFHEQHRPYVVLKWAQSVDEKISGITGSRTFITNEFSNRLVHKWRSEEAAILVGTNTALLDDPHLNTRLWPGPSPIRLVVDMDLRLPDSLNVFTADPGQPQTIVFNGIKHDENSNPIYFELARDSSIVHQILVALFRLKIQSVLVEGGARLLQSFIDEDMWDEARIITNKDLKLGEGLQAPHLPSVQKLDEFKIHSDKIQVFANKKSREFRVRSSESS